MATDTPRGFVELWEDFTRDNVTNLNEVVASGATQDITNRHGGWWRQVIGGDDADALLLAGERAYEADEGSPLEFEWRGYATDVSVASFFVGFSDDEAETGAVVFEDEDGTMNSVAADAFGFLLEGQQDETFQAVGVQNDVDNNSGAGVALTAAPDARDSIVRTLRMEAYPRNSGAVLYYIDGALVSTRTSWFRSSIVYVPLISCDDRATAYNLDTDYLWACAPRS